MPFIVPTRGDVHVNGPLSRISVHHAQAEASFVSTRAFRNVPVVKQSDRYFVYDRGEFNRDEMQERAPGTESAGGTYAIDNTPTYFAKVWAFHRDIPDQLRSNADNPLNLDLEATVYLTTKMLIRQEVEWRQKFFTTGLWSTDFTPGTLWNAGGSTPIEDVRAQATVIGESTGLRPNVFVVQRRVYDVLLDHVNIVDRLNRGQTPVGPALTNRQQLAAMFEVDEVLVMDAIENTAQKGISPPVHGFIGGRNALLCYRPPSAGIMTPAAGYTFSWTGFMGAQANGSRIKRFRQERIESDRVEIQGAWAQKVISADLGVFFNLPIG